MAKSPPPTRERLVGYHKDATEQQPMLLKFAESTGGRMEYLQTPGQANRIYSKILAGINNRYVIGYYAENETKDGKRRTVGIAVKIIPNTGSRAANPITPPSRKTDFL